MIGEIEARHGCPLGLGLLQVEDRSRRGNFDSIVVRDHFSETLKTLQELDECIPVARTGTASENGDDEDEDASVGRSTNSLKTR